MPALSALEFMTTRLLDRDAGGVFTAADVTGRQPLSTDKYLPDQASAVLALAEHGALEDLRIALAGLLRMQDRQGYPGFTEFTDRYWQPYPGGQVRTIRYQLHGATALLAAAHRLDLEELRIRAVDLMNRCLGTAADGQFPSRLTEDWRSVVREAPTPQTAVSALRAVGAARRVGEWDVDAEALPAVARRLAEHAGAPPADQPLPELRRCGAVARLAVALIHAGQLLAAEEYLDAAERVLGMVLEWFLDPEDGAFWDRLAPDGTVRVDWIGAPERGAVPFPVKRAADAAQLLLAGRALESCGVACTELTERAVAAIAALTDHHHGGVRLAMGYQWATVNDGAATSTRLRWAPPRQPGRPGDAGPFEVILSQKTAHTQATVVRALAAGDGRAT